MGWVNDQPHLILFPLGQVLTLERAQESPGNLVKMQTGIQWGHFQRTSRCPQRVARGPVLACKLEPVCNR